MKTYVPTFWNPFDWEEEFWQGNGSDLSIWEDQHSVTVEAVVPGMDLHDIELSYNKGVLWIKADRKEEEKTAHKKYYRKSSKTYSYRIAIPGAIDEKKEPEATLDNGILQIKFKKMEQEKPKKIAIKTK